MNEQEAFWKGTFGTDYAERNQGRVDRNKAMFAKILPKCYGVKRIIELGAGTGENLAALKELTPAELWGVEINEMAAQRIPCGNVIRGNALSFTVPQKCDLAFTKGFLIHVHPDDLPKAYAKLVECSTRYVLVCEYYNPTPLMVRYRGENDRLWKRDFAGELMDAYQLELVDYGFIYHRDLLWPQDDISWFLMERE